MLEVIKKKKSFYPIDARSLCWYCLIAVLADREWKKQTKEQKTVEWKNWVRRYGIHIMVCGLAAAVAFGVNRKINLDRNHIYAVTETTEVLNTITDFEEKQGTFVLRGWGFSPTYYDSESVQCELILQNTQTGEAVWPKMDKNPEVQEIEERYTDGGDYSKGSFEGKIKASKLDENQVYEVLLRYTSNYVTENGDKQTYIVTVRAGEFLCGRDLTEYNPETFIAPKIAGTELEKELGGTRLFHYFPEGLWIYYDIERIYYIAEKSLIDDTQPLWFPCFWYERNIKESIENGEKSGEGLMTFPITVNEKTYVDIENYRVWSMELPPKKIIRIMTGLYVTGKEKWLLQHTGRLGEIRYE